MINFLSLSNFPSMASLKWKLPQETVKISHQVLKVWGVAWLEEPEEPENKTVNIKVCPADPHAVAQSPLTNLECRGGALDDFEPGSLGYWSKPWKVEWWPQDLLPHRGAKGQFLLCLRNRAYPKRPVLHKAGMTQAKPSHQKCCHKKGALKFHQNWV